MKASVLKLACLSAALSASFHNAAFAEEYPRRPDRLENALASTKEKPFLSIYLHKSLSPSWNVVLISDISAENGPLLYKVQWTYGLQGKRAETSEANSQKCPAILEHLTKLKALQHGTWFVPTSTNSSPIEDKGPPADGYTIYFEGKVESPQHRLKTHSVTDPREPETQWSLDLLNATSRCFKFQNLTPHPLG